MYDAGRIRITSCGTIRSPELRGVVYGIPLSIESEPPSRSRMPRSPPVPPQRSGAVLTPQPEAPDRIGEIRSPYRHHRRSDVGCLNAATSRTVIPIAVFPFAGTRPAPGSRMPAGQPLDTVVMALSKRATTSRRCRLADQDDLVQAYLPCKISAARRWQMSTPVQVRQPWVLEGMHALAIVGYALDPDPESRDPKHRANWRFQRIAKLLHATMTRSALSPLHLGKPRCLRRRPRRPTWRHRNPVVQTLRRKRPAVYKRQPGEA